MMRRLYAAVAIWLFVVLLLLIAKMHRFWPAASEALAATEHGTVIGDIRSTRPATASVLYTHGRDGGMEEWGGLMVGGASAKQPLIHGGGTDYPRFNGTCDELVPGVCAPFVIILGAAKCGTRALTT